MSWDTYSISRLRISQLADTAGCARPDDNSSPGALFLDRVRNALVEAMVDGTIDYQDDYDSMQDAVDDEYAGDYHSRALEYADLYGWDADISPDGDDVPDQMARALDSIAEALGRALMDDAYWSDDDDEDEYEEDEEEEEEEEDVPVGVIPGLPWVVA